MNDRLDDIREMWSADIADMIELFTQLNSQKHKDQSRGIHSNKQRKLTQEYWMKCAKMIRYSIHVEFQESELNLAPLPILLLVTFADVAESLGSGVVPDLVESARGFGRPLLRHQRIDIATGVFFLLAVENKEIICSSPIATVARNFGVSKQTVRNWKKRATELCDGITPAHSTCIESSMIEGGMKYSISGRGATEH